MTKSYSLHLLPGDGIGPEVIEASRIILDEISVRTGVVFNITEGQVGGAAIDACGKPISDADMEKAKSVDAVLLGAVGGPKWDGVDFEIRPEAGLLALRKNLDLFANLRPAQVFNALADSSTLKRDVIDGLDILIVREGTAGVYFGEPRGVTTLANGDKHGIDTQSYTTSEIERIATVAFELARQRRGHVTSVEKANVMVTGRLWREVVTALHETLYSDVKLSHMLADNCGMQLVRDPKQFDVIVTDNLFGDMLSDQAAMLTGSLGMLPSASLGPVDERGSRKALYEPVHGSAPDIAGQNKANPCAMILSLAMCLRYSLGMGKEAAQIETAVSKTLIDGFRTGDIMSDGGKLISTTQMSSHILKHLTNMS